MSFTWNPRVFDDALRMAGKGLQAATIYAANCTKEILSVPAPRVRITDSKGAMSYKAGIDFTIRTSTVKRRLGAILGTVLVTKQNQKDLQRIADAHDPSKNPYLARSRMVTENSFKFPKGGVGPAQLAPITYLTAPAIKGEPPRKLSGRLRASVTYEFLQPMKTFEGGSVPTVGRVGTNVKYARRLEYGPGDHEFLHRVFRERRAQIEQVLYDNVGATI